MEDRPVETKRDGLPPLPPHTPMIEARIVRALERIGDELAETRKVLEALPDRRDLIEAFVSAALVLDKEPHTPEALAEGVRRVSDAVWAAIHGAHAKPVPPEVSRG